MPAWNHSAPWRLTLVTALVTFFLHCGSTADTTFRDRGAWRLENDLMRVAVLEGGGHVAELILKNPPQGEAVNPLWIPPWPSIEPQGYDPAQHGDLYGRVPESRVLSGIMGHNVCFDLWGRPSDQEAAAGLPFHGEASNLRWVKLSGSERSLACRVDLPLAQKSLTRVLRLLPQQNVLYFEETAENKLAVDEPIGWTQHVTFGPPFVDPQASVFDASATQGYMMHLEDEVELDWRNPPEDPFFDFHRVGPVEHVSRMAYFVMDRQRDIQFISALNTDDRLLTAYLFRREDFPWLAVWEENRERQEPPWNGKALTRGMEFGNTRISGTNKSFFASTTRYNTPSFGWLDAKSKRTVRYLALLVSVPPGFEGVSDIHLDGSWIVIEGRGVEEPIRLAYQPLYFDLADLQDPRE